MEIKFIINDVTSFHPMLVHMDCSHLTYSGILSVKRRSSSAVKILWRWMLLNYFLDFITYVANVRRTQIQRLL